MPATRTSARLAKTKGKRVNAKTDKICDDPASDANYEQVESDQEEVPNLPRKRPRITKKAAQGTARKKQVRGKQGRLAGLVGMPIDIFTEVASHLLPGDIISLARSNKFFRNLLMHRSAIHIWHGAMKNVKGLPPCPPAMSEPRYMALLFSKTCSTCGSPVRTNMDPMLLVRLCGPCRSTQLMPLDSVPFSIMPWVLSSGSVAPPKRRLAGSYALRQEVSDLLAQYEEKIQSDDDTKLAAWVKERKEFKDAWRERSLGFVVFLDALEWDRSQELNNVKEARRSEIERRLLEMGWTEEDMAFDWWSIQQRMWDDLVLQPKPLTDRVWVNLQPKLTPLLESNREERLKVERENRKYGREEHLSRLLRAIKEKDHAELELEGHNPLPRLSTTKPTVRFVHRGPFPGFTHALDWPLFKDLYEIDSTVEEMKANFEKHRAGIEALITEWANNIQTRFVNLLRDGYESKGEVLRTTIAVSGPGSDPLANISDDVKLLLRADSLFQQKPIASDPSKRPFTYDGILSSGGLSGYPTPFYGSLYARTSANLDIQWYPEAHKAAQELLVDMGKPDASYLEMNSVGSVFVCGRCHDNERQNWQGMVQHYVEQKQLYAKIQEDESPLSDEGITYNDVHDPALFTDQPMVTDFTTKSVVNEYNLEVGRTYICQVCPRIPAAEPVIAPKSEILKHLSDVHDITEPEEGEHYVPEKDFDSDLEEHGDYDSDDSYPMLYGCSCPYHMMLGASDYGDDSEDEGWW